MWLSMSRESDSKRGDKNHTEIHKYKREVETAARNRHDAMRGQRSETSISDERYTLRESLGEARCLD